MAIVNVPGLVAGAHRERPFVFPDTVSACRASVQREPIGAAEGVGTRRHTLSAAHLPQHTLRLPIRFSHL